MVPKPAVSLNIKPYCMNNTLSGCFFFGKLYDPTPLNGDSGCRRNSSARYGNSNDDNINDNNNDSKIIITICECKLSECGCMRFGDLL